jgi:transcriptional regulator with XRE-family HTH domain
MTAHVLPLMSTPETAGRQLRHWRDLRGKSQLDLALDTGISQKHVSFVETGRSTPSRQMIIDLADALRIPLRERNAILLAAGFAPAYRDEPLEAPQMAQVARAVERLLRQHEPFPALVLDRYWNVIETNAAAPAFFSRFIDLEAHPRPRNLLHLMFDPAGLRPHIARFPETARSLLQRLRNEAVGQVVDIRTRALMAELMAYPEVPQNLDQQDLGTRPPATVLPMIPIGFRVGAGVLDLFSMITTVGTPQTVTAEEMRIETMFPADDAMERLYRDVVGVS